MKLITISGLDGSGKTTQLDLLEKELKKDFKVKRFHMIDFSIANKILKRKKTSFNKKPYKAQTQANFWGILLRKIAIIIDVFRFRIYYQIKVFENKLDYLLIDRYFYDQIVNIKYLDLRKKIKKQSFWQTIAENYIIQPNLKVYLKIKPEKILARSKKIEQDQNYLFQKNRLYNLFIKKWKMITVDGQAIKSEIQTNIKNLL